MWFVFFQDTGKWAILSTLVKMSLELHLLSLGLNIIFSQDEFDTQIQASVIFLFLSSTPGER